MIRTLTNDDDKPLTDAELIALAGAYYDLSRVLLVVGINPEARSAKEIAIWYTKQAVKVRSELCADPQDQRLSSGYKPANPN